MKGAAYKGIVRTILEYGSSVWGPYTNRLQEELEKVQNRAALFVTRNYAYETGSILGQLEWESLKKRRKDNRLILLYKGLKGKPGYLKMTFYPLLVKMSISIASSPRLSGTGMTSLRL